MIQLNHSLIKGKESETIDSELFNKVFQEMMIESDIAPEELEDSTQEEIQAIAYNLAWLLFVQEAQKISPKEEMNQSIEIKVTDTDTMKPMARISPKEEMNQSIEIEVTDTMKTMDSISLIESQLSEEVQLDVEPLNIKEQSSFPQEINSENRFGIENHIWNEISEELDELFVKTNNLLNDFLEMTPDLSEEIDVIGEIKKEISHFMKKNNVNELINLEEIQNELTHVSKENIVKQLFSLEKQLTGTLLFEEKDSEVNHLVNIESMRDLKVNHVQEAPVSLNQILRPVTSVVKEVDLTDESLLEDVAQDLEKIEVPMEEEINAEVDFEVKDVEYSTNILSKEISLPKEQSFETNDPKTLPVLSQDNWSAEVEHLIIEELPTIELGQQDFKARFQLTPESLGAMDIELRMQDNELTAIFTVEREQTKEWLNEQVGQLMKQLAIQDIQMSDYEVVFTQNQSNFTQMGMDSNPFYRQQEEHRDDKFPRSSRRGKLRSESGAIEEVNLENKSDIQQGLSIWA